MKGDRALLFLRNSHGYVTGDNSCYVDDVFISKSIQLHDISKRLSDRLRSRDRGYNSFKFTGFEVDQAKTYMPISLSQTRYGTDIMADATF